MYVVVNVFEMGGHALDDTKFVHKILVLRVCNAFCFQFYIKYSQISKMVYSGRRSTKGDVDDDDGYNLFNVTMNLIIKYIYFIFIQLTIYSSTPQRIDNSRN